MTHILYNVVIADYSFKSVFVAALNKKIATENPKSKTVDDYWDTYHAFITEDFGAKDIRRITPSEVKEYIQQRTQQLAPKKKRFYKFKGVLNLVFCYAVDPERRYIDVNPVPKDNWVFLKNCTPSSNRPEDKAFQPEELELLRSMLWRRIESSRYDVNAFAILFAMESGCREAEIPSVKKSDIIES